MRLSMDLPHLKLGKSGNAKYRRRVTSAPMRAMLGKSAVEWTLKTRDPLKIVEAWKAKHAEFEALEAKAEGRTTNQIEWEMLHSAAVAHGLVKPGASKIGPVDSELESGRFDAFTAAALAEADKATPQQASAKYGERKPVTSFELLAKAQMFGVEQPAVPLSIAVKEYLRDRERRSSYPDIEKQVSLVVATLEEAIERKDPVVTSLSKADAFALRDHMIAKGNSYGTVRRRITTIKSVLNRFENRHEPEGWRNPFSRLELPEDDGMAGEQKRLSLSLEEIRKVRDQHASLNSDAKAIWHLMLFTGVRPNEARGLLWEEVHLDHPTPHFEVKPNARRRLKVGETQRRIPLVGSALTMMQDRRREASKKGRQEVFPRYAHHRTANSVSATLVKSMQSAGVWVKYVKVPYSLRHSIKNWLRRTTPKTLRNLVMGHGHGEGGAADDYGDDELLDMQATHLTAALEVGGVIDYPTLKEEDA